MGVVVRASVPKMLLDDVFEQKNEVALAVASELEKVIGFPATRTVSQVLRCEHASHANSPVCLCLAPSCRAYWGLEMETVKICLCI